MANIIGLVGFKQVGKSTAAKYIEKKYGFTRINFKDALVQEIKDNFPDLLRELSQAYHMDVDKLFQNKPIAMRALMQNYGTDVRRKDDDSYWVEKWMYSVLTSDNKNIVCDDVRFLNENGILKDASQHSGVKGIIIRLTRSDITTGGEHVSETEMLDIKADYTIDCKEGEHDKLYKELDAIIKLQNE